MTEFLIYKYPIKRPTNTYGIVELYLPIAAKILSCEVQNGHLCIWAEFVAPSKDETVQVKIRTFQIVGTGHRFELTPTMEFIATVQQPPFVWHIYELKS